MIPQDVVDGLRQRGNDHPPAIAISHYEWIIRRSLIHMGASIKPRRRHPNPYLLCNGRTCAATTKDQVEKRLRGAHEDFGCGGRLSSNNEQASSCKSQAYILSVSGTGLLVVRFDFQC